MIRGCYAVRWCGDSRSTCGSWCLEAVTPQDGVEVVGVLVKEMQVEGTVLYGNG